MKLSSYLLPITVISILGFIETTYSQTPIPSERIRRGPLPPSVQPQAPPSLSVKPAQTEQEPGKGNSPLPGETEFVECKKFPDGRGVSFTLKPESELIDLIGFIKSISCRPFIFSSLITTRQAKVTIIAPELVSVHEAYRIFLSALETMGFTVQPSGKVLKIILIESAKEGALPTFSPNETPPANDQFVTKIFRLRYANPETLVSQVLSRKKTRNGDVTPYVPGRSIIVTDNALSIKSMEEIIKSLDVPTVSGEKPWLIHLNNMLASDAKQELDQMFNSNKNNPNNQLQSFSRSLPNSGGTDSTSGTAAEFSMSQVILDERTNSLILVGTESAYRLALGLMEKLDVPGGNGGSRINTYDLENGNAEDLATVLQSVCGGGTGASSVPINRTTNTQGRPNAVPIGLDGLNQSCQTAKITANKATNSLVIVSTTKEFLTLKEVIQRLDKPRRQVFIEGFVIDVGIDNQRDLGVSFHGGAPVGSGDSKGLVLGGLQSKSLSSLNPTGILGLAGLLGGAIGPSIPAQYLGLSGSNSTSATPPLWGVLIQASQTSKNIDYLQVPNILTTDNEKSSIEVGQSVPFLGGISGLPGTTGTSLASFQSVQRQNVTFKLELTPHVNSSDLVRLEIDTSSDDLDSTNANFNGLGPITNTKKLKTTVVVRDQQPIVLGGIVQDKKSIQETKIPLLGDIPILGYLFKTKSTQNQKQMLMIVLKPYIIRAPGDLQRIFEIKNREKEDFREANLTLSKPEPKGVKIDYEHQPGVLDIINSILLEADKEFKEKQKGPDQTKPLLESGAIEPSSKKL